MKLNSDDPHIKLRVIEQGGGSGTNDYLDLINKPSINGEELIDNYNEKDPTVPGWAKENFKPTYTPDEVGALSEDAEMTFSDVETIFNMVFNTRK